MGNSILDRLGDAKKAQKHIELQRQSEETRERAHLDEVKRREYEEQLRREKTELIKLKQGMADEGVFEEEKEEKVYTVKEKIANFFYHNKYYVIAGALVAAVFIFLGQDYLTTERPDISVMYIAEHFDLNYTAGNITDKWSGYTPDLNRDKRQLVKLYYAPAYYSDSSAAADYLYQADRTKIIGEFQSGDTIIIIGNMRAYEELGVEEGVFADARELFPGDENAEEIGYKVSGTRFKEMLGDESLDDSDLYFSFRKPQKLFGMSEEKMQKNFDDALAWFRSYLVENRKTT